MTILAEAPASPTVKPHIEQTSEALIEAMIDGKMHNIPVRLSE